MVVLRWVMRILATLAVLVGLVFVGARLHDGPPGRSRAVRWRAARSSPRPSPVGRSRPTSSRSSSSSRRSRNRGTTWIVVHDGKAYVPAAVEFPPGKTWHRAALEDGRATLRIAGKRYPVTLTKVEDATVVAAVRDVAFKKYPARPEGEVWLFAVTSRPPAPELMAALSQRPGHATRPASISPKNQAWNPRASGHSIRSPRQTMRAGRCRFGPTPRRNACVRSTSARQTSSWREAFVPGEEARMGRAVERDVEEADRGEVRKKRELRDRERAAENRGRRASVRGRRRSVPILAGGLEGGRRAESLPESRSPRSRCRG